MTRKGTIPTILTKVTPQAAQSPKLETIAKPAAKIPAKPRHIRCPTWSVSLHRKTMWPYHVTFYRYGTHRFCSRQNWLSNIDIKKKHTSIESKICVFRTLKVTWYDHIVKKIISIGKVFAFKLGFVLQNVAIHNKFKDR